MIVFLKFLIVLSVLQLALFTVYGGAAGMLPIWLFIAIISFFLCTKKGQVHIVAKRWFKIVFSIGIIVLISIEGAIISQGFLAYPTKEQDYIIILGAQIRGDTPSLSLKYRLDAGIEYLIMHPNTKVVVSGGQGEDELKAEAEVMYQYLVDRKIEPKRIIKEEESHSTYENLTYSFKLIEEDYGNNKAKIAVVSNRFHILRAKMQAEDIGKKVAGIGARSYPFLIINYYFREFFAVLKEVIV